jgi:hypothetical protein
MIEEVDRLFLPRKIIRWRGEEVFLVAKVRGLHIEKEGFFEEKNY